MVACPNPKIVLSSYLGEIRRFCLWWPAQTPKSSYLGEIRTILLCGGLPKQNRPYLGEIRTILEFGQATTSKIGAWAGQQSPKIVLSRRDKDDFGDFALWWPAQTSKSSLSRRDTDDFGVCAGHHKAKSPCLAELERFWGSGIPKSSYLGEIRRFCFVVACPNPKIVLSRRDKAILLCGGLPKP